MSNKLQKLVTREGFFPVLCNNNWILYIKDINLDVIFTSPIRFTEFKDRAERVSGPILKTGIVESVVLEVEGDADTFFTGTCGLHSADFLLSSKYYEAGSIFNIDNFTMAVENMDFVYAMKGFSVKVETYDVIRPETMEIIWEKR